MSEKKAYRIMAGDLPLKMVGFLLTKEGVMLCRSLSIRQRFL